MRDRKEREQEILQAVGRIFIRDGFGGIGINSIAREAKCNKVLIYRYFTDLDGLFRAFAKEINILDYDALPQEDVPLLDQVTQIFLSQLSRLRENPLLQEVMKFEMLDSNALTEALAVRREESGLHYLEKYGAIFRDSSVDIGAVTGIISAGITYMVLRSQSVSMFNGVDLQSEDGWKRIEKAIAYLIQLLFTDLSKEL